MLLLLFSEPEYIYRDMAVTATLNVVLTPEQIDFIKAWAKQEKRSISNMMRLVVDYYRATHPLQEPTKSA